MSIPDDLANRAYEVLLRTALTYNVLSRGPFGSPNKTASLIGGLFRLKGIALSIAAPIVPSRSASHMSEFGTCLLLCESH